MIPRASVTAALAVACLAPACTPAPTRVSDEDTYLRWIAHPVPGNENVLLRWPRRKLPLRIHLPRPSAELFSDPEAVHDSVRDGVLDWEGVVEPGVPSFTFTDDPGDADIPIVWAAEPDASWFIAHCVYDIQPFARRFGVARILVTARWHDDEEADLHVIYATVLHEMGHALGLTGHSPHPEDIMYAKIERGRTAGLSPRDRRTLAALYTRPIGTRITGARGRRN